MGESEIIEKNRTRPPKAHIVPGIMAIYTLFLKPSELAHRPAEIIELGALSRYEQPLPALGVYDQLLSGAMSKEVTR